MRLLADNITHTLEKLLPLIILAAISILGRVLKKHTEEREAQSNSQKMRQRVEEVRRAMRGQGGDTGAAQQGHAGLAPPKGRLAKPGAYEHPIAPRLGSPAAQAPLHQRPQPQARPLPQPPRAHPLAGQVARPIGALPVGQTPPLPRTTPRSPQPAAPVRQNQSDLASAMAAHQEIEQRHYDQRRLGSGVTKAVGQLQGHMDVEDLQRAHHLQSRQTLRTELTARFQPVETQQVHVLVDLSKPRELLKSIIYSEIIGLPKALRHETEMWDL